VFAEDDDWEETLLPARARTPWLTRFLALAAVAALAFGGGAYAHRTWGSSGGDDTAGTGAVAGARAARVGGALGAGTGQGQPGQGGAGFGGLAGTQPTVGEVKYIEGDTLYVETTDGTTVKVRVAKSVPVAKTETTDVSGIDAGDQVVVVGEQDDDGMVVASQVSVGGLGGLAGRRAAQLPGGGGGADRGGAAEPPAGGGAGFQPGG
jgi:hypothetical protein